MPDNQVDFYELRHSALRGTLSYEHVNLLIQMDIAQSLRTIVSAIQPDEDIPDVDER